MWVYAIKSLVDGRIYVGISADPIKRLKQHNLGATKSTKGFRPWKLILQNQLDSVAAARAMELKWKSGSGKEMLKRLDK